MSWEGSRNDGERPARSKLPALIPATFMLAGSISAAAIAEQPCNTIIDGTYCATNMPKIRGDVRSSGGMTPLDDYSRLVPSTAVGGAPGTLIGIGAQGNRTCSASCAGRPVIEAAVPRRFKSRKLQGLRFQILCKPRNGRQPSSTPCLGEPAPIQRPHSAAAGRAVRICSNCSRTGYSNSNCAASDPAGDASVVLASADGRRASALEAGRSRNQSFSLTNNPPAKTVAARASIAAFRNERIISCLSPARRRELRRNPSWLRSQSSWRRRPA